MCPQVLPVEQLAIRLAKIIGIRRNVPDWRDLVTGAYLGVSRARANGSPEGAMVRAAVNGISDLSRVETFSRRKKNPITWHQFEDDEDKEIVDYRSSQPYEHRVLQQWVDTHSMREHMGMRCRLVAYLKVVEGNTVLEIMNKLGVCERIVYDLLAEFKQGLGYKGTTEAKYFNNKGKK